MNTTCRRTNRLCSKSWRFRADSIARNTAPSVCSPPPRTGRKFRFRSSTAKTRRARAQTLSIIYGYGSYGYSLPVGFNSNRLSLLDRGFVLAYAHIRGGGDMGKPWHDAGRLMHKMNTFTDFIAVTEYLTAHGYGDPRRVAMEGGSAGGLLMGAVANMRPDLYRAVVSHVPFVDVMNTMLDPTLPLTIAEYEEWGDPNQAEAFAYMLQYSPYDNLEARLTRRCWSRPRCMTAR